MLPWLCPPTFECVCLNMGYHYSKSFGSPAFLLKYGLVWGIIERHTRLSLSMKKGWRTRRFQSATPQLPSVSGSTYFETSAHYHLYLTLLTLQSLKDFWSSTWKPQALWVSLGLITTSTEFKFPANCGSTSKAPRLIVTGLETRVLRFSTPRLFRCAEPKSDGHTATLGMSCFLLWSTETILSRLDSFPYLLITFQMQP